MADARRTDVEAEVAGRLLSRVLCFGFVSLRAQNTCTCTVQLLEHVEFYVFILEFDWPSQLDSLGPRARVQTTEFSCGFFGPGYT